MLLEIIIICVFRFICKKFPELVISEMFVIAALKFYNGSIGTYSTLFLFVLGASLSIFDIFDCVETIKNYHH